MRIITDTGSDILADEAKKMNLRLVQICTAFDSKVFCENTEPSFQEFYQYLRSEENLPISSQPSPDLFLKEFEQAEEDGEDVIVITISSKLSGTYNGACLARNISGYEKIYIIDSRQASLSERALVEYAVQLRDSGRNALDIVEKLESIRTRIQLTGVPVDLKYLKKGGRISPAIAELGDMLGIKPVLILKDGVIECTSKARGCKAAKKAMQNLFKENPFDSSMPVYFAHSDNIEKGRTFQEETCNQFNLTDTRLYNVGPAIGTHIGPDALLMCWVRF